MKVIIATGGTGGHIFPAVKVAERLRERGWEVVFVGALSKSRNRIEARGYEVRLLEAKGMVDTAGAKFLSSSFLMLKSFIRSVAILREHRPNIVLGFGGYSSFPVICAGRLLGIPTMIHEQNAVPGKANRFLGVIAHRVAVSFKETAQEFDRKKTIWTGCPCHDRKPNASKKAIYETFGLKQSLPTILVIGGSQGSQRINTAALELLTRTNGLQAIHMTGPTDYAQYVEKYKTAKAPVQVRSFIDNIEEAYAIADCVIGRAGAATVCELAAFAIPSVLIPYPFANSHQIENARVLEKLHMSTIIEQDNLTFETLSEAVHAILPRAAQKDKLRTVLEENFLANADQILAGAVVALSHNKKL